MNVYQLTFFLLIWFCMATNATAQPLALTLDEVVQLARGAVYCGETGRYVAENQLLEVSLLHR